MLGDKSRTEEVVREEKEGGREGVGGRVGGRNGRTEGGMEVVMEWGD